VAVGGGGQDDERMRFSHRPNSINTDGKTDGLVDGVESIDEPPSVAAEAGAANLRLLYTARALRSFGVAFLTVVFPLYLDARGYSSSVVGGILSGTTVISALLVLVVGLGTDRLGPRRMLVFLAGASVVGGLVMAGTTSLPLILVASGLGGVGRGGGAGSGGAWGPVFPAEQPLLAESAGHQNRTAAFGFIGFIGVLAGAVGSLVAWVPDWLEHSGWSASSADRLVFLLGAAVSLGLVGVSLPLRDGVSGRGRRPVAHRPRLPVAQVTTRHEPTTTPQTLRTGQLVWRLALTNSLNGFGFGFLGPLLTYWFHVRFGVGAGELGVLYTCINLATALPYLGAARLARRLGAVTTVTVTRALSIGLLVVMIWAPDFVWAGVLYGLRMALNSLGLPARQSYVMGVAQAGRRGTVAALGSLPSQITSSLSPAIGGALMSVFEDAPLVGAAAFMGANVIAYWLAFHRVLPPEEQPGVDAARRPDFLGSPEADGDGPTPVGPEPLPEGRHRPKPGWDRGGTRRHGSPTLDQ
jgi:MFS family permease